MFSYDGEGFHMTALLGPPAEYADVLQRVAAIRPGPDTALGRIVKTKQVAQITDAKAERAYAEGDPIFVAAVEKGGVRTILGVPMLKEDKVIGAILIYRQRVRPFADKQIALVQNFAAQAVVAIENTRLLKELRERTDQLANLNQQLEGRVADQVGEIERMSRLRRFLPPQMADLIVASGTEKQLESHRRDTPLRRGQAWPNPN
jgi:adenylate cyclase